MKNTFYYLSRWRERVGVRVVIVYITIPSPLSSPPWGEEINVFTE
jgi:hypothetical protein